MNNLMTNEYTKIEYYVQVCCAYTKIVNNYTKKKKYAFNKYLI